MTTKPRAPRSSVGATAAPDPRRIAQDVDRRLTDFVASARQLPLDAQVRAANKAHAGLDEERFKISPPPEHRKDETS